MRKFIDSRQWLLLISLLLVTLVAAQCASAPTEPAPAPTEAKSGEEAKPTEDSAAAAKATADTAQNLQQSEASQAKLATGSTFVTDEMDVSAPRSRKGGEYRDVSTADAVSFHPYQTTDTGSSAYQGMVYSGSLLDIDEKTLDYKPHVAQEYSISEDGLTFTFKLRKDLKWSDGKPITAQDYKWTYDQVMKPENEFPYLDQFDFITSYKAVDDYTLEIKIDKIYCPALSQIDFVTPLPKHVWEKLDWNDPEKNPEINSPTVYSGPYKLKEWKRDQYATFEANDSYWYHGAPNMTGYNIEIVPDQDVAYEKMKSGQSDTGIISPENLAEARKLPNINVYEWWPAAAVWTYVGLNMREGFPTHDINVRHGLSYALDKDTMTDEIMVGQAKRQCSAYPDTSWVYNPDVPCYDYSTDKAIEAFTKAGYTFKDGKMLDKDGKPLTLKLIYGPNTSQVRELIAVSVQDYLKKIGIEVEVQGLEWASFLEATDTDKPDWDMFVGAWRSTIEPNNMFAIWSEESIPSLNSVAYINKKVESLFEEAGGGGGTCDPEFRKQRYQEIQKILADESPYIFLWYQKVWSGQNKRIQGIEPSLLGIGWNQEDWYIKDSGE